MFLLAELSLLTAWTFASLPVKTSHNLATCPWKNIHSHVKNLQTDQTWAIFTGQISVNQCHTYINHPCSSMFIHFPHGFTIFPMFFPSFIHLPDKLHLAAVLRADTSPAWHPAASRSKHHSRRRPCGSANRCLSLATGGEEWKVVPSGNRLPSGDVKIAIENSHL
jgi:hypothetical protein